MRSNTLGVALLIGGTVLVAASFKAKAGLSATLEGAEPMITLDLARCEPGEKDARWTYGTVHVSVLGLHDEEGLCEVEVEQVAADGTIRKRCALPVADGEVQIAEACGKDIGGPGYDCVVRYPFSLMGCANLPEGGTE